MKKLVTFSVAVVWSLILATQAFASNPFIKPILTWNDLTLDTARAEQLGAASASRLYAMVNAAMYDAVNGIDVAAGRSTREAVLVDISDAPRHANKRAAAMAAAHAVLVALYPERETICNTQLEKDLDSLGRSKRRIAAGLEWGARVGYRVVELRAEDGSSPAETLPGGSGPGEFSKDFTSAQYRNMTPFGIADKAPYRSPGPPSLTSREYLVAHHDVRLLGDAAYENQGYEEIFKFWKGGKGSGRPPGEWIKIAMTVAAQQHYTRYSLSRTARLFALLGMALGDSTITAWDSKYTYHFWRPATAINHASTDGNSDTMQDASWEPRNGSIGGSPEHTSGQSTYAGAGSTILAGFFCNDAISFTFEGDNAIAGSRTFESFSDAATEAGRARIFAGIHFEFSNQAGQKAGRGVAREILANRLLRNDGRTHYGSCPR